MNAVDTLLDKCNELSKTYHREYMKWLDQFDISKNLSSLKDTIAYENICKPDQPVLEISNERRCLIMMEDGTFELNNEIYGVKIKINGEF